MTETAASDRVGTTNFFTDGEDEHMEWGGGILPPNIKKIALDSKKRSTNLRKEINKEVT